MVSDGMVGEDVVWEGRRVPAALFPELEQRGAAGSRRRLARWLCEQLDWRGPAGRRPEMQARKLLAGLVRTGRLRLPAAAPGPPAGRPPARPPAAPPAPTPTRPRH